MAGTAGAFGNLPGAALENRAPWPAALVGAWFLCLLAGRWVRLRPHYWWGDGLPSAGGGVACAALVALVAFSIPTRPVGLAVTFLDVGQGDAVLVEASGGATMLFDAGPDRGGAIVRDLRRHGVERLDLLVLSHADADHIAGAPWILRSMPVGRIVVGGSMADTQTWERLVGETAFRGTPVSSVQRGARIRLSDSVEVTVMHPVESFTREGADRNDASVVLRIESGDLRFLLTGDAEEAAEREMVREWGEDALATTVLQAGHHGAATSTGPVLVAATRPRIAVISCGRRNPYGHPRAEVLDRLARAGAQVFRTDLQGTVRFWTDGERLEVRTERGAGPGESPGRETLTGVSH